MEFSSVREEQDRSAEVDALEIYVLSNKRSAEIALTFLEEFGPHRTPVACDFPFPEFVDEPTIVFNEPSELIRRLEQENGESYSIYWNVDQGIADQVMLFFTADGEMIVGLGGPHVSIEAAFAAMQKIVSGRFGYVTSGTCPPSSKEEFVSLCERSTLTNLFDGKIRTPHPK
jgi:hypothetical protein